MLILLTAGLADASSPASRNKEGNRLYSEGRYQDAERAYVDAQTDAPGKPELLYNMGNALLKQKKYAEALQALRQAVSRGSPGLRGNGWYNLGNALFEMGKYREAADSFIQALRVNPADRDAKQNLELSLLKLQEEKKSAQGKGGKDDQQKQDDQRQQQQQSASNSGKDQQPQPEGSRPDQQKQQQSEAGSTGQSGTRDQGLTRAQALQMLDALQNQELAEQRKLLERHARQKAVGRDW